MVPGLDALVGRLLDKSTYFSLPLSSIIFTEMGNRDLNAVAVALSYNVAVNVLFPILIFILLPVEFKLSLFATEAEFLEQVAQLAKDITKETRISNPFIIYHLEYTADFIKKILPNMVLLTVILLIGNWF